MAEEQKDTGSDNDKFFDRVTAQLGERFADYLLIARHRSHGLQWRSSDETWARGACDCYLTHKRSEDELLLEQRFLSERD